MGYEAGEAIGAVATASYEARAFGVESAMPISEALDLLPRRVNADPDDPDAPDPDEAGRYLPVDLDFYKEVASDVKTVLRDCADVLREVSVDEAYLDVTDRTAWDAAGGESTATGPAETRTLARVRQTHQRAHRARGRRARERRRRAEHVDREDRQRRRQAGRAGRRATGRGGVLPRVAADRRDPRRRPGDGADAGGAWDRDRPATSPPPIPTGSPTNSATAVGSCTGGRGATTTERSRPRDSRRVSRESSLSATADEERSARRCARSPPTWPVVPASGAVCTAPSGSRRSNLPTR